MYFHPDHLGSSSYVTDKKGNFFEMIEYLPYGETLYDEAATVDKTEFRFTSKEQDAETGLYYHGARYRDAKTGVWLSCDPYITSGDYFPVPPVNDKAKERNKNLPGMGGVYNPVNLNGYHYAGNNPVKYVDPDGNEIDYKSKIKSVALMLHDAEYYKKDFAKHLSKKSYMKDTDNGGYSKWVTGEKSKQLYDFLSQRGEFDVIKALDNAYDKSIESKRPRGELIFDKKDTLVIIDSELMQEIIAAIEPYEAAKGGLKIDNLHFEKKEIQTFKGAINVTSVHFDLFREEDWFTEEWYNHILYDYARVHLVGEEK